MLFSQFWKSLTCYIFWVLPVFLICTSSFLWLMRRKTFMFCIPYKFFSRYIPDLHFSVTFPFLYSVIVIHPLDFLFPFFKFNLLCILSYILKIKYLLLIIYSGGGNGNPLQYSCLEHPMDRGVWQATVHGVAKSRTRATWLSTFIYLAALGLSCNTRILSCRMWDLVSSNQGFNLGLLHWRSLSHWTTREVPLSWILTEFLDSKSL